MKINRRMLTATLRSMAIMAGIAVAALVLTAPAHAEAVGEMPNANGGVITLYNDACPTGGPKWFLSSTASAKQGVQYGCWTFANQQVVRVYWNMPGPNGQTVQIPANYRVNDFHDPMTM